MISSPIYKTSKFRFWLWPIWFLGKILKSPINPGIWFLNSFYQRILDINNEIPWMVHYTSKVSGKITIGKNVWISFAESGGCYIQGINGIEIGDFTVFAPGVKIISANHSKKNLNNWDKEKKIIIGKNVWIGANAVILPGVNIGDGAVIGASALVNSDVPSYKTAVGVPARILD